MRKVHAYVSSQPHYTRHLAHTWLALPDEYKGNFYTRPNSQADLVAKSLGIKTTRTREFRKHELTLIAGFEDYRQVRLPDCVFWNHGVGQTYFSPHDNAMFSSYSGGKFRDRTIMFVGPSERDAALSRAAYPGTPCYAIGVPYTDQFVGKPRPKDGPVVVSFHANIQAVPETRNAFQWIQKSLAEMLRNGTYNVVGHSHPRVRRQVEPWFAKQGVSFEPDWWKVLETASCYVIDNSSSAPEIASLGVPVVWMSPPHYRRDIIHGCRFWSWTEGMPHVQRPEDLEGQIQLALDDPPSVRAARERMVAEAYEGLIDGKGTERGVRALIEACEQ